MTAMITDLGEASGGSEASDDALERPLNIIASPYPSVTLSQICRRFIAFLSRPWTWGAVECFRVPQTGQFLVDGTIGDLPQGNATYRAALAPVGDLVRAKRGMAELPRTNRNGVSSSSGFCSLASSNRS